jgi:SAM-dependent methyltransferase/outer membrane protein assembly factor BamB
MLHYQGPDPEMKGGGRQAIAPAPYETLWTVGCDGSVIRVAATPNLSLIAAASVAGSAYLLDHAGSIQWQRRLDGESWAAAVSADGLLAAFGTATKRPAGGAVHIFSRQGRLLWQREVGAPVWGAALSATGDFLYVGSWDHRLLAFSRDQDGWRLSAERRFGDAGIYGVATSAAGDRVLVSVYAEAVLLLDQDLRILRRFPCAETGYETRLAPDGQSGIVGLRGGRALRVDCRPGGGARPTAQVSQNAVGGATATPDGRLAVLGCFDGAAYALNHAGQLLWRYPTSGEVWSVCVSPDGGLLCMGSGDRQVRLVRLLTDCQALAEVEALEDRLARRGPREPGADLLAPLCDLYLRYGLVAYGTARLLAAAEAGLAAAADSAHHLLRLDVDAYPDHAQSQFLLAGFERRRGAAARAAVLYVRSGQAESLRLRAMLNAGDCFQEAGLESAAMSCFRRARQQYTNDDDRRVLYNLARAYEDRGDVDEATRHYGVLLTWDPDYRDVFERLTELGRSGGAAPGCGCNHVGPSLSLLGPDIPRREEVDPVLLPVLDARAKELHVSPRQRDRLLRALGAFLASQGPPAAVAPSSLTYDEAAYALYDRLPPEDEIKKQLEAINLFDVISDLPALRRSLDIGAATGRHPAALAALGVLSHGIDVEWRAVAHARRKTGGARWPVYLVGDGRRLPYGDDSFDLITCMMGTIAHMPAADQLDLCREARRCLRPGGCLLISTWDVECRHLTFLSMYSQEQKELVRRNSLPVDHYRRMLEDARLELARVVPFALLPDVFGYELGVRGMTAKDLRRLVEIDMAARASFPAMPGQMFMAAALKPPVGAGRRAQADAPLIS